MKKLLILFVLATTLAQAQYTVKGTMFPADKGDWVMLERIQANKEHFVANTTIKFDTITHEGKKHRVGTFELKVPKNTKPGMYRLKYRLEGKGFVDFIFNNENVELGFNPFYPRQSVQFSDSKENKVFQEFIEANTMVANKVDSLQVAYFKEPSATTKKEYANSVKKLKGLYKIYDDKSKGMLANHYINSGRRHIADAVVEDRQDYYNSILKNFFNHTNFDSEELFNSRFLIDRIGEYVFMLNYSAEPALQEKLDKESITKVMSLIKSDRMKKTALEFLIEQFAVLEKPSTADWLFANYYDKLPMSFQDSKFRQTNLDLLRSAIGRTAPDFSWKEGKKNYSLSSLDTGKDYLLIFWSTGCSHCVRDIPELYKFMQNIKGTKVIAFSIEKEDFEWNEFIKQLYGWHNVIGLNAKNKWKHKVVRKYNLYSTPSYFILDKNKKIIAKPKDLKDVEQYYTLKAKKEAEAKAKKKIAPKNKKVKEVQKQ